MYIFSRSFGILILIVLFQLSAIGNTNSQMNSAEIYQAIKKLNVLGSVLYIAAHPDDENTAALSYFSNHALYRTGYLSLTRGDGGQNLIGKHKGDLLGVIRTHELLEARKLDGAEQFFSRAIDFGYSKSPEESIDIWGHEETLADIVWVIRNFKPDIVLTRFTAEVGGHGHHRASAQLAIEAFEAAADPQKFPEQLKHTEVWQAKRIMWNTWKPAIDRMGLKREEMPSVDLGSYNTYLGKSYGEISAESRSMHKSQGFGRSSWRGTYPEYFLHLAGEKCQNDLMEGIDTRWSRIDHGIQIEQDLQNILQQYNFQNPSAVIPELVKLDQKLSGMPANYWVDQKRTELKKIIKSAAGLWIDLLSDVPEITPGDTLAVTLEVVQRSTAAVQLNSISLPYSANLKLSKTLENNILFENKSVIQIPQNAPLSQCYWLKDTAAKGHFNVSNQWMIGTPSEQSQLTAEIKISISGAEYTFNTPVVYRWTDPVQGEKRRQTEILPPVVTATEESLILFPNSEKKKIEIIAKSHLDNCSGHFTFKLPDGWQVTPAKIPFQFKHKNSEQRFQLEIIPGNSAGKASMEILSQIDGQTYSYSEIDLKYDHIPYQSILQPAKVQLLSMPIEKQGNRLGYVMGSGDEIPQYLSQLGFDVEILSEADLTNGSLAEYDAIITGIRAYNTQDFLSNHHTNLLKYVEEGGTLVMQYNTGHRLVLEELGPYPFKVSRSRVSVEDAPVTILKKDHPLLNVPNQINADDFSGWVQERGLYFLSDWDKRYQTVISSNDPQEKANAGGLLYLPHGKGVFIYSSLSWFRQLPAGVPGAYRLFVNLVSARN